METKYDRQRRKQQAAVSVLCRDPSLLGDGRLRGPDGLLRAIEQLSGAVLPASAIETAWSPPAIRITVAN